MKMSLAVTQALGIIRRAVSPLASVRRSLGESLGCILAEDVRAPFELPLFTQSAMDGYAVRSADVQRASRSCPVRLRVTQVVAAGHMPRHRLQKGGAVAIMTGSPLPRGADSVIRVEDAVVQDGRLCIFAPVNLWRDVRRRGELIRKGDSVLKKGKRLGAVEIGVLASFNKSHIRIIPRPRVAIITTGDELIPVGARLPAGKIPDSNHMMLRAQLQGMGLDAVDLGIVPDRKQKTLSALRRAARQADAVITIGGVSMGRFDFVRGAIQTLGRVLFWKVKMKPGGPQTFGIVSGIPVFGLPGNPVSSLLIFRLFVRPALEKMAGGRWKPEPRRSCILLSDIHGSRGKDYFHPVRLSISRKKLRCLPLPVRGSHHLIPWLQADGIAHIPQDKSVMGRGEAITVTDC